MLQIARLFCQQVKGDGGRKKKKMMRSSWTADIIHMLCYSWVLHLWGWALRLLAPLSQECEQHGSQKWHHPVIVKNTIKLSAQPHLLWWSPSSRAESMHEGSVQPCCTVAACFPSERTLRGRKQSQAKVGQGTRKHRDSPCGHGTPHEKLCFDILIRTPLF